MFYRVFFTRTGIHFARKRSKKAPVSRGFLLSAALFYCAKPPVEGAGAPIHWVWLLSGAGAGALAAGAGVTVRAGAVAAGAVAAGAGVAGALCTVVLGAAGAV
ncbi:hypothetical protein, partial [Ancylobacter sp.]|uniref:hypothetical protein n=1 Tax=Ancylobacter sp. TaxID=1872567 RepID=UPI003C7C5395